MNTYGTLFQNGYVVKDIDSALKHWTKGLGVGPFFTFNIDMVTESFGAECHVELKMAVSYWNDVNIELTEPISEANTPHRDFLQRGREGLQQLGVTTKEFNRTHDRLLQAGFKRIMTGHMEGGQIGYYNTDENFAGTLIELVEETPFFMDMLTRLKTAAANWDGTNPIRPLEQLYA